MARLMAPVSSRARTQSQGRGAMRLITFPTRTTIDDASRVSRKLAQLHRVNPRGAAVVERLINDFLLNGLTQGVR